MKRNIKNTAEKRTMLAEIYWLRDKVLKALDKDDIRAYNSAIINLREYVKNTQTVMPSGTQRGV